MKKWLPVIVIVGLLAIGGFYLMNLNNSLVELNEGVSAQWGNVESSYQRRADLIPNIVNTAKGYAEFEQETLIKVTEARSKATSVTIDPSNITPEQLQQFQEVQSGLTSALARLLAVFERYPDLKANENFKELINELERTENRINVERNRYNEMARPYNTRIKKFPASMFAGMLGFEEHAYFEAKEGSEEAPVVEF
ncbi:LemA family protein [Pukyongia salina]|uniref:LemA family protein n=1 Tax=Pukyongia salina TaxID=2094025 RepID=A0A2S0HY92_9FLAO|nr:LemA family protein [Pukyongia salina]AVI51163.1 LemA family protein [Pukyongia salina]